MSRALLSVFEVLERSGTVSVILVDFLPLVVSLDNFASNRHKSNAKRSPATSGSARRTSSDGAAAPSSLQSSSCLPQPPLFASNASLGYTLAQAT